MTLLLDDHLLLSVLLGDELVELHGEDVSLATTGLWYHRLCRALSNEEVAGSMSRRLGDVDAHVASAVIAAVIELPSEIEMLSLRTLGWPMANLVSSERRLNLLSLEALAAAVHLDAEICLAEVDDNEPLRTAAQSMGVAVRSIAA